MIHVMIFYNIQVFIKPFSFHCLANQRNLVFEMFTAPQIRQKHGLHIKRSLRLIFRRSGMLMYVRLKKSLLLLFNKIKISN